MPNAPQNQDRNNPRRRIEKLRAGDPITESFLSGLSSAIADRRGVSNPPTQVKTAFGGGGVGTVLVVGRVATSNITLSGTVSVDGANAPNGSLVLAQNQTIAANRGIWKVNTAGAWTQYGPFQPTIALIVNGSAFSNTMWYLSGTNSYKAVVGMYG